MTADHIDLDVLKNPAVHVFRIFPVEEPPIWSKPDLSGMGRRLSESNACTEICDEFRNGATRNDDAVCVGPEESWGTPCYPLNADGSCNDDMTLLQCTAVATPDPTPYPTAAPTASPTPQPTTAAPTPFPTTAPTVAPTHAPTVAPTFSPTPSPTTPNPTPSPSPLARPPYEGWYFVSTMLASRDFLLTRDVDECAEGLAQCD